MNTTGDFSEKLHELQAEMARGDHELEVKKKQVEEIKTAIEAARKLAKEKEMELERVRTERVNAEREEGRKQNELGRAERELHEIEQKNARNHAEFQKFQTEYNAHQGEHPGAQKKTSFF